MNRQKLLGVTLAITTAGMFTFGSLFVSLDKAFKENNVLVYRQSAQIVALKRDNEAAWSVVENLQSQIAAMDRELQSTRATLKREQLPWYSKLDIMKRAEASEGPSWREKISNWWNRKWGATVGLREFNESAYLNVEQSASAVEDVVPGAAFQLMEISGMKDAMSKMVDGMVDVQFSTPEFRKYKDVAKEFFNKYLNYDTIKVEFAKMYEEAFTEEEMRAIIAFYETPAGQKAIEKLPELSIRGGQFGVNIVEEHQDELIAMLQEVDRQ